MALTQEQLQQVMAIMQATLQETLAAAGVGGATNDRAGGGGRRRIHEKDFRRVDNFSAAKTSGRCGSSTLRSRRGRRMQSWLRQWRWPRLNRRTSPLLISRSSKTEKWDGLEDKSRQLYDILCMLSLGEAKSVIREVSGGDGIAAWQALAKSYARRTLARVLRRYREVMNPVHPLKNCRKWWE